MCFCVIQIGCSLPRFCVRKGNGKRKNSEIKSVFYGEKKDSSRRVAWSICVEQSLD